MKPEETQALPPDTHEELVAYLDGELPPEKCEQIERRLASDPRYREQLKLLEKTWDLLDTLPTAEPNVSFTRTTMELAVSQVKSAKSKGFRIWQTWLVLGTLAALLLGISYWATRKIRMRPYEELITDLPIIANFDVYRKVDLNLDFLRKLSTETDLESHANPQSELIRPSTVNENEQRLKSMDALQLKEIQSRHEQYGDLPPEEKNRIRNFHGLLVAQPDCASLTLAMRSYYEWLKTLQYDQQMELLVEQDTDRKFAVFQRLRKDLSQVGRLPESDITAFNQWIAELANRYGKRITQRANDLIRPIRDRSVRERILTAFTENPEAAVRAYLTMVPPNPNNELLPEYATLKSRLSQAGQQMMGDDPGLQYRFIQQILAKPPEIDAATLENFYFQELTAEEREQLDRLSPELMKNRVQELYRRRKLLLIGSGR